MMNKLLRLMGLLLVTCLTATAQQDDPVLLENITGNEAKPGTRWWWMGSAVDNASLKTNLKAYAEAGLGTVEITPIYGLQYPTNKEKDFLSDSWMKALKTTQEAAAQYGIDVDMNNGTGWPFGGPGVKSGTTTTNGTAAGMLVTFKQEVTADGSELSLNLWLGKDTRRSFSKLNKVLAYPMGGTETQNSFTDVTDKVENGTLKWAAPKGEWLVLAVYDSHTMQDVKRAAPGGEGLVLDHFNADAVREYLKRFDDAFQQSGVPYPHTFFNDSYEVYNADWTPAFFEEFYKYRGYRLEEHMHQLMGLAEDPDNQVLADYRHTISDMLLNNFTKVWVDWAHSHGAMVRNQAHGSPANLIDVYAMVDIPEIEGFGITDFGIRGLRSDKGFTRANYSDFPTLKYASSAAHITGKKFTSSETFTWLTEHFRTSLSQMKPDMDLMFVAGVNHMLFHGTTYTPQYASWPGWKFYASIDMSPTNSIWRDAPQFLKYIERCQSYLQSGRPDNDFLVYAPFEHAWHKTKKDNQAFTGLLLTFPINDLTTKMAELHRCVNAIEKAGYDCDYISSKYLLSTTCVDGMLQTVGGTRYKALVVPTDNHMPQEVKDHLKQLADQGAQIVYAYGDEQLHSLATPEALRTQLGLRTIRRQAEGGGYLYFISNLSATDIADFVTLAKGFEKPLFFDPMTGRTQRPMTDGNQIYISLKSGQSVILLTDSEQTPDADFVKTTELPAVTIDGQWKLSFTESWPETDKSYDLGMLKSWETLDTQTSQLMGTGVYETNFRITPQQLRHATAGFRLNLGDVRESARVYVNDQYVGCAWCAPFELDLGDAVHEGVNSLRIEVTNLPANRIRQMDIDRQVWRIFDDVNILAIKDGNIGVSGVNSYADWALMPSGLNSKVQLIPLHAEAEELSAQLVRMDGEGEQCYPVYSVTITNGTPISTLDVADAQGRAFSDVAIEKQGDGSALVTVKGRSADELVLTANGQWKAYVPAYGAYREVRHYDFATNEEPADGWTAAFTTTLPGFSDQAERRVFKKNGTELEPFSGLHITSLGPNYVYFFPGYGMYVYRESQLAVDAKAHQIGQFSYVQGGQNEAYASAEPMVSFTECTTDFDNLVYALQPMSEGCVYRSLIVYEPVEPVVDTAVPQVVSKRPRAVWYNLMGTKIDALQQKGIYIREGRKIVVH